MKSVSVHLKSEGGGEINQESSRQVVVLRKGR